MILQINIDDKLYKQLRKFHSEEEIPAAARKYLREKMEDIEDARDADEISAKVRSGEMGTVSYEEVMRRNGLAD